MKKIIFFTLIASVLCSCGQKQAKPTEQISLETTNKISYGAFSKRERIILNVISKGDSVTGTYQYILDGKTKTAVTFKGLMPGTEATTLATGIINDTLKTEEFFFSLNKEKVYIKIDEKYKDKDSVWRYKDNPKYGGDLVLDKIETNK